MSRLPLTETLEPRTLFAAAGDQISEAIDLGALTVTRAAFDRSISSGTNVDMYSFTVTDGQEIAFDIDRQTGNLDSIIRLFDEDGNELASNDDALGPNESNNSNDESYLVHEFEAGGTYYVGVSGYDNKSYNPVTGKGDVNATSTGQYTLSLIPFPDSDADDQLHQAIFLGSMSQTRTTSQRSIGAVTDVDTFSFTVKDGEKVSFDIDRPSRTLDSYLRLFDLRGRQLAANDDGPAPGESPTSEGYIEYTFAKGGTYYISVSGQANDSYNPITGRGDQSASTGPYTLRVKNVSPPVDLLPDLIPWASRSRGYMYDYEVDTITQPGRTLMRFSTTSANIGAGPMEIRGGEINGDEAQNVYQRVYDNRGGHTDRLAGEFIYHPQHGHIHFDDYARYRLREVEPDNKVGDIIAGGQKTSFALLDTDAYDLDLPDARQGQHYTDAGQVQGISVGWSDVYEADLPDQWIDVTDVPAGTYWLEVIIDPKNNLSESDETNNRVRIKVDVGTRKDLDDQIGEAHDLGRIRDSMRVSGYSISNPKDVDMFKFRVGDGERFSFDIDRPSFTLDSYIRIFDADGNEIAANDTAEAPGESSDDESYLRHRFTEGGTYYVAVSGFDNTNFDPITGKGDVRGSTASYWLYVKPA
jgi:hypothetical protein